MDINTTYRPQGAKYLFAMFTLPYVGACVCTLIIGISFWLKLMLIFLLVAQFIYFSRTYKQKMVTEFSEGEDGRWYLHTRHGAFITAILQHNSIITRYFTLLNFRCMSSGEKYSLYLFRGVISLDEFRYLRFSVLRGDTPSGS